MKKISLITLLVFYILTFSVLTTNSAEQVIPAPFGKIKELSLKAKPDINGDYLLVFKIQKDGELFYYIMGYLSREGYIGIGKIGKEGKLIVFEFNDKTHKYYVLIASMFSFKRMELPADQCIKGAFGIFRELVENNLI